MSAEAAVLAALEAVGALARGIPAIAEALRRIVGGHPSARRVHDILDGSESARVAEELRGEAPP